MSIKRFDHTMQLRIKDEQRRDLADIARKYGMTPSDLARLSMKAGLSLLRQKLPIEQSERQ
jgi:antitoxin component of RelBE/YafQ-DinJ toxin-antitoxin module